ncbi:MAG: dihydroneopterin aldolase family protein [Candidatus Odinarchaeum yellowstonii]|uniref:Dihydroneopterin aldolase n=1 Tax=Odinarchaeota yellowstonii (strain LCB_4) TaxID=1841599 RepID=A0AAF0D120_ODILC|nr:MAG: dihydroneopterin aldolase family protein [Candidatus Odinarchaeum yellowstonii]
MKIEDEAKKFFPSYVTDRDRALFEAGIKIGAIYHQFIGTPIPKERRNVRLLEEAIEESVKTQPWVKDVKIIIKPVEKNSRYGYDEISKFNFIVSLTIKYNNVEVEAGLQYNRELEYPLFYIKKIQTQ